MLALLTLFNEVKNEVYMKRASVKQAAIMLIAD